MQTGEVLNYFYEIEVEKRRLKYVEALEDFFQNSLKELSSEFSNAFQQICIQLQKQQFTQMKGPIANITFSMLRTEMLDGKYLYLVEGTDEEWFFDMKPLLSTYDASWAFQYLDQLIEELILYSKTFMGAITQADIELIKLQEAVHFHQYVISLARYALPDLIRSPEYLAIERDSAVEIRVGEYMDINEVVYAEDYSIRDVEEIKAWLDQKLEEEYPYEVFSHLNLSSANYESLDLRYAFFQKTNLSYCQLRNSLLTGGNFKESQLVEADLSFSEIQEADFRYSQLQGANFQQVQGARGLPSRENGQYPGYFPVRFTGANLEGANFELANLQGACFIDAKLQNVQFAGANLEGAVFSKEAKEDLTLDSYQASQVIWK